MTYRNQPTNGDSGIISMLGVSEKDGEFHWSRTKLLNVEGFKRGGGWCNLF